MLTTCEGRAEEWRALQQVMKEAAGKVLREETESRRGARGATGKGGAVEKRGGRRRHRPRGCPDERLRAQAAWWDKLGRRMEKAGKSSELW